MAKIVQKLPKFALEMDQVFIWGGGGVFLIQAENLKIESYLKGNSTVSLLGVKPKQELGSSSK
jgi:hypothetical protein